MHNRHEISEIKLLYSACKSPMKKLYFQTWLVTSPGYNGNFSQIYKKWKIDIINIV